MVIKMEKMNMPPSPQRWSVRRPMRSMRGIVTSVMATMMAPMPIVMNLDVSSVSPELINSPVEQQNTCTRAQTSLRQLFHLSSNNQTECFVQTVKTRPRLKSKGNYKIRQTALLHNREKCVRERYKDKIKCPIDGSGIEKARNGSTEGRQFNANQRVPSRDYCWTGRIV